LPSNSLRVFIGGATMSKQPASQNGKTPDDRPVIFAVDDEPMLLELATLIVEPLGFRVETFRDPIAAARAFSLSDPLPELIITDFSMHQMNGLDLIRDCRRIHPEQKILMVSGTVNESVYKDSPHKPDAFLAKPYQATTLARFVAELTGRD
jgi:CheY-like chemotaxis protein